MWYGAADHMYDPVGRGGIIVRSRIRYRGPERVLAQHYQKL